MGDHRTPAGIPITRFTLAICATALLTAACIRSAPSSLTLSIVGTNDLHGGVLSQDGRGGLALLDGYVRNLRAARSRDGGAVLLLDAGDLFQGTLESNLNEGAVVVAAYNAIGYDAAAIGNHEFDFGPVGPAVSPQSSADDPVGALKARVAEARFPFLTANIIDKNTSRPVSWPNVKPSALLTVGGVKVGVVGLATSETLTATLSANTRDLDIAPLAPTLESEARRLRDRGATIVIGLAHAGGRCTKFDNPADLSSCQANAEIFDVARALPPGLVDAIVAGHRHEGIAHEVAGMAVISSYSSGRAFGRVDLSVDRSTGRVTQHHIFPPHDLCESEEPETGRCAGAAGAQARYEGAPVTPSQEIQAILEPAVLAARHLKQEPLNATIEDPLPKGDDETALGDLLADWMRASARGVDVAIANTGGIRQSLPSGTLTYGRLFELTPFDNREALLTLTGAELTTVVRRNLEHRGDMIILSGARATATCGIGGLHVTVRRDSGQPVRDSETLKIVTTDFIATAGSDILSPVMPLRSGATIDGPIVRDEIAHWLARAGRSWRARDGSGPANRRLAFEGTRPVQCDGGQ